MHDWPLIQKHALNVLCEGSSENYNKDGDRSESFNNFSGTYRKYTKYIDYVPWPTPCEVAVEISRMANCEHLAAENMGQSRCCQTNEPKHQYLVDGYVYEITKERHSVRAASRFSLNVLRFESDLCELNRL